MSIGPEDLSPLTAGTLTLGVAFPTEAAELLVIEALCVNNGIAVSKADARAVIAKFIERQVDRFHIAQINAPIAAAQTKAEEERAALVPFTEVS
jgi:hypothetical protein